MDWLRYGRGPILRPSLQRNREERVSCDLWHRGLGVGTEHDATLFYNAFRLQGLVSQLTDLPFNYSNVQTGAGTSRCEGL